MELKLDRTTLLSSFSISISIVCIVLLFFIIHKIKLVQEKSIIKDSIHESDITGGEFVKTKNGRSFILHLPYEIGNDIAFIFVEDTPYAIDIIEMRADGEKLLFVDDIRQLETRSYYNIKEVIKDRKKYFIFMQWDQYSNDILRWNDGRGLVFNITGHNENSVDTFSYEISREMKMLEITYRIVLPYPKLSIENLYDKDYKHKKYTDEYKMIVDLSNIFP